MPEETIDTLERGNIYFIYRPKVTDPEQDTAAEDLDDVQRSYLVLAPHGKQLYRLITLGPKRLPEIEDGGDRNWSFVDMVEKDPKTLEAELQRQHYQTKTRGERVRPAARPAGEGVYALVRHGDHTHLAYALELPDSPGEVQKELNIEAEGSYILSVKNPQQPSPKGAGLQGGRKADFPEKLQQQFQGRRFIPADPPQLLDYPGAELLLIAAAEAPTEELGIELDAQAEDLHTAEIINDLRMVKSRHPVAPLLEGEWR